MTDHPPSPRPPPLAYRRGRDRADAVQARASDEVERLIAAALEVLGGSATADLSVRDVVRIAGLSNAAFYRHFKSKDELLLAIVDFGQRTLVAHLEARMAAVDDPAGRIAVWVRRMLAQAAPAAARPTRPFVLDLPRLYSKFPGEMNVAAAAVMAPLTRAIAALDPPVADVERAVMSTYDVVDGALQRHLLRQTSADDEEQEAIVAYVLRALGASGR
ncbi:MAG TPA: helix-turn-helix domain-containing protein [Baekduia sp.]